MGVLLSAPGDKIYRESKNKSEDTLLPLSGGDETFVSFSSHLVEIKKKIFCDSPLKQKHTVIYELFTHLEPRRCTLEAPVSCFLYHSGSHEGTFKHQGTLAGYQGTMVGTLPPLSVFSSSVLLPFSHGARIIFFAGHKLKPNILLWSEKDMLACQLPPSQSNLAVFTNIF